MHMCVIHLCNYSQNGPLAVYTFKSSTVRLKYSIFLIKRRKVFNIFLTIGEKILE